MRVGFVILLLSCFTTVSLWAQEHDPGKFGFLDAYEQRPSLWTPEVTSEASNDDLMALSGQVDADLFDFYEEFERDGKVKIYIGYGHEAYFGNKVPRLMDMLKAIASQYSLQLGDWELSPDQRDLKFKDIKRSIDYEIRVGTERNEYAGSFSEYEIVMYAGHSRYGRGPAFQTFWNYYRMGDRFDTIEVDARNPYFMSEPTLLGDIFPLYWAFLSGSKIYYQYRGQRNSTSYLPEDAYTRNVPGGNVDLSRTRFLPGRQIIYFHSCKNEKYWRKSLRQVLPDSSRKFIFGTWRDSLGGIRPDAVMVMSIVRRVKDSSSIVSDLNATRDCDECFTSY